MMGVRVVCFILMVVITPYGWYTWVLAAGAVFIPYIAVVLANVGADDAPPRGGEPGTRAARRADGPPSDPPTPGSSASPRRTRSSRGRRSPSPADPPA